MLSGQQVLRVRSLTRCPRRAQIVLLPEMDIRNDDLIKKAISRSNVVINCVGMRLETMNWSFEEVHVDFPKRLAQYVECKADGHGQINCGTGFLHSNLALCCKEGSAEEGGREATGSGPGSVPTEALAVGGHAHCVQHEPLWATTHERPVPHLQAFRGGWPREAPGALQRHGRGPAARLEAHADKGAGGRGGAEGLPEGHYLPVGRSLLVRQ